MSGPGATADILDMDAIYQKMTGEEAEMGVNDFKELTEKDAYCIVVFGAGARPNCL